MCLHLRCTCPGRASIDVGAGGGVYARQLWAGAVGSISRRSRLLSTPQATRQYRAQPEAGLEGTARALRLVMDARTSAASLAGTGSGGGALQGGPGGTPGGGASNSPSAAQVALPGLVVRIGPSNPGEWVCGYWCCWKATRVLLLPCHALMHNTH
jgi:hypothetical protein